MSPVPWALIDLFQEAVAENTMDDPRYLPERLADLVAHGDVAVVSQFLDRALRDNDERQLRALFEKEPLGYYVTGDIVQLLTEMRDRILIRSRRHSDEETEGRADGT